MKENNKVLVSIINWNNNQATTACLESIARISIKSQPDVLLVDNHSTKQQINIPKSTTNKLRSYTLIKNTENLGFAGAHNQSLLHGIANNYDYVFLLNNDTFLADPGIFDKLTDSLVKNKEAIAAAPTILSDTAGTIWYGGGEISKLTGATYHNKLGETYDTSQQGDRSVSFLSGCCLAIKVSALKKFDTLLDDGYFMYWEDADWSAQVTAAGYTLLYVPEASIVHDTSSSLGFASPAYIYYITRGNLMFVRRNITPAAKPIAYARTVLVSCKYLIRSLMSNTSDNSSTFKALWFGWFDGITRKTGKLSRQL